MHTTHIGDIGEQIAAEELTRLGYDVIERNWKTKWAEIDIVALKNQIAYLIEVKYRQNTNFGDGFDYITPKKLLHMQRAAELWVNSYGWNGQYELLGVSVNGTDNSVEIREIS